MKKKYLQPSVSMDNMALQVILAVSGVTSGKGIGYGGVDENGTIDPSSRSLGLWDDEEDE